MSISHLSYMGAFSLVKYFTAKSCRRLMVLCLCICLATRVCVWYTNSSWKIRLIVMKCGMHIIPPKVTTHYILISLNSIIPARRLFKTSEAEAILKFCVVVWNFIVKNIKWTEIKTTNIMVTSYREDKTESDYLIMFETVVVL